MYIIQHKIHLRILYVCTALLHLHCGHNKMELSHCTPEERIHFHDSLDL